MPAPQGVPPREARLVRFGGLLIVLAGLAQAGLGAAAIAGADRLEANVLEIESNEDFGSLYFSLEIWGLTLMAVAAAQLLCTWWLLSGRRNGRLAALLAASVGLAVAFASLAIFRWAGLATIPVLMLAIFFLSRHERG